MMVSKPITVAARELANTGVNSARHMDVSVVQVQSLRTAFQGILPNVYSQDRIPEKRQMARNPVEINTLFIICDLN